MIDYAARKRNRLTFGEDVIEWIEANCVLPTGEHIGQPFELMDWQKEFIRELFRTKRGKMQYRWALLGVPKGNGKSPLAAALALYHLLGDPDVHDPWVVVAAASDKQADIVFDACKRMCEMSPELAKQTRRYRWEIQKIHGTGKLERVAASRGKLDGKLVSLLIMDELHEWTMENWVVLTGGAMKRDHSQIIQITTAGWDRDSICYREFLKGEEMAGISNPSYLVEWHSAPYEADWRDPETWKLANPSYGGLVSEDTLRDLSINVPESQFRRYRLNQWVESEEFWLPPGTWEACADEGLELTDGAPTWVGWDASTSRDSTAVVLLQERDGDIVVKGKIWSRPRKSDGNYNEAWRLPIAEVEQYVRDAHRRYQLEAVAFDPAYVTWSASELEAEGLPMVKWAQSPSRMVPSTAALYEAVVQGMLRHDGDQVMARHVKSVRAKQMRMGGEMLEKSRRSVQIDAAIALTMAIGAYRKFEQQEEQGVVLYVPTR